MPEEAAIQQTTTGPVTIPSLLADFAVLGVQPGMTLLLHSSLSALGWVCGGPVAVILALEQLLGPDGTLVAGGEFLSAGGIGAARIAIWNGTAWSALGSGLDEEVRALAVTSARRWTDMPDVPTMLELGYLDKPYDTLFGVVAPAGTPAAIVARLNAIINDGLRSPASRAALDKLGIEPWISSPQEFAAMIAEEAPKWAEAVRVTGIKVEQ